MGESGRGNGKEDRRKKGRREWYSVSTVPKLWDYKLQPSELYSPLCAP